MAKLGIDDQIRLGDMPGWNDDPRGGTLFGDDWVLGVKMPDQQKARCAAFMTFVDELQPVLFRKADSKSLVGLLYLSFRSIKKPFSQFCGGQVEKGLCWDASR